MDEYIIDKIENIKIVSKNNKDYQYMIDKIKLISNDNIKNFMNKVTKSKNRISDVEKTIIMSINILTNENFNPKDKLVIFYYIYFYHRLVLNNSIINLKERKKLIDVEYKKPNSYTGYDNDNKYFFKIIADTDTELNKIYKNYKIMEMFGITLPEINLDYLVQDYKTLVLPENRKLNSSDNVITVFIQILNILRQFNDNNFYVIFDYWNIRCIKNKYYLLNLSDIKKTNKINTKNQIIMLKKVLDMDINILEGDYNKIFIKSLKLEEQK